MKQLFFALYLSVPLSMLAVTPDFFHARKKIVFNSQQQVASRLYLDALVNDQVEVPNLSLEYLAEILHPITRSETEQHILFFGPRKSNRPPHVMLRVSCEKATGNIRINELSSDVDMYGEINCVMSSEYERCPQEIYSALQALYEKQQRDAREQAEEREENKQEEEQENQEVQE